MPAEALGQYIRELVQADAAITAALAPMLAAYDTKGKHLADGQKKLRTWLVHTARVTRGQAAQYEAVQSGELGGGSSGVGAAGALPGVVS